MGTHMSQRWAPGRLGAGAFVGLPVVLRRVSKVTQVTVCGQSGHWGRESGGGHGRAEKGSAGSTSASRVPDQVAPPSLPRGDREDGGGWYLPGRTGHAEASLWTAQGLARVRGARGALPVLTSAAFSRLQVRDGTARTRLPHPGHLC